MTIVPIVQYKMKIVRDELLNLIEKILNLFIKLQYFNCIVKKII